MAFNNIGQGEGLGNRPAYQGLGKTARAAADSIENARRRFSAARAEAGAAAEADDADATQTAASESRGAAEKTATRFAARDTKLLNGLRKQSDSLIARFAKADKTAATKTADDADAAAAETAAASTPGVTSSGGMSGLSGWLNDFNLGDLMSQVDGLTGGSLPAGTTLQAAQAQFSLNLSVVQTVSTANGVSQQSLNMSLKMDMSWLSVGAAGATGSTSGTGSSNGIMDFLKAIGFGGMTQNTNTTGTSGAGSVWDGFMDYYSPEKTADRILNFATAFYPSSKFAKAEGGDTEENRQAFADYIGAAIQKGFDQAQGILGKVDKTTQGGIDDTHTRVFDGLRDFVKNGLNANKEQQGVYANAQSWQLSVEMNYSYSKTTYSSTGYANAATPAESNPAATAATLDAEA